MNAPDDVHALTGAYAVDALDEVERAAFEAHLERCPACQDEVRSLREAAATLADSVPVEPPPELRARVMAEIGRVRPLPPLSPETPAPVHDLAHRRKARSRRFPALVAAAVAAAAVTVGAVAWHPWTDESSQAQLSATDRVLGADDAVAYDKTFEDGSKAVITVSASLNQAVVETTGMAAAPKGHAYELWLQHDGVMVPAGFMPAGADNRVLLDGDPATAQAAAISVEPEGGSPEPTGPVVAVFAFESA